MGRWRLSIGHLGVAGASLDSWRHLVAFFEIVRPALGPAIAERSVAASAPRDVVIGFEPGKRSFASDDVAAAAGRSEEGVLEMPREVPNGSAEVGNFGFGRQHQPTQGGLCHSSKRECRVNQRPIGEFGALVGIAASTGSREGSW